MHTQLTFRTFPFSFQIQHSRICWTWYSTPIGMRTSLHNRMQWNGEWIRYKGQSVLTKKQCPHSYKNAKSCSTISSLEGYFIVTLYSAGWGLKHNYNSLYNNSLHFLPLHIQDSGRMLQYWDRGLISEEEEGNGQYCTALYNRLTWWRNLYFLKTIIMNTTNTLRGDGLE